MLSLQAEIDRGRGLAVMLFQIEANIESLVIYTRPNVLILSFSPFLGFGSVNPTSFYMYLQLLGYCMRKGGSYLGCAGMVQWLQLAKINR